MGMMDSGRWFWLIVGTLTLGLLILLAPILSPFLIAALLAYLGDPLVDRLEAWKLSRTLSVSVVFLGIISLILLVFLFLVPVLETQVKRFITRIPEYIDWGTHILIPYLRDTFGVDPSVLEVERLKAALTANWKEAGGFIRNAVQSISQSGLVILGVIVNLALIPILTFYLLRDWDHLTAYIHDLLPRSVEPTVVTLVRESDEVLGAFLRGQMLVMMALGTIYSVGLGLIGLEFALLIGLLAGVVSFVPYLGFIVGIGVAGLAVLFQTQDVFDLFWVLVVFGIAQAIEGSLLTPLLVGERIGLHPVTVIFAVLAGGQLFGFVGILLALPVAAIIAVVMRHLHDEYKQSHIYRIRVDTVADAGSKPE